MDFVEKIKLFNDIAGTREEYNTKKVGLYTGLVLEEVSEMLDALGMQDTMLHYQITEYASRYKAGMYDLLIDNRMKDEEYRNEFLDACVDISVVSLGGAIAIGSDVSGACHAVADNNLSKFPIVDGKHTVLKDENGKVKKPLGYKPVDLKPYLK